MIEFITILQLLFGFLKTLTTFLPNPFRPIILFYLTIAIGLLVYKIIRGDT